MFPGLPSEHRRLDGFPVFLLLPTFLHFLQALFPEESNGRIPWAFSAASGIGLGRFPRTAAGGFPPGSPGLHPRHLRGCRLLPRGPGACSPGLQVGGDAGPGRHPAFRRAPRPRPGRRHRAGRAGQNLPGPGVGRHIRRLLRRPGPSHAGFLRGGPRRPPGPSPGTTRNSRRWWKTAPGS
ncbi:MAG: hypothetical protein MZV64_09295 [Ignavibacteriales bacterium]|nr:hypothetical protein [Ignavibacteriales bacterium]